MSDIINNPTASMMRWAIADRIYDAMGNSRLRNVSESARSLTPLSLSLLVKRFLIDFTIFCLTLFFCFCVFVY